MRTTQLINFLKIIIKIDHVHYRWSKFALMMFKICSNINQKKVKVNRQYSILSLFNWSKYIALVADLLSLHSVYEDTRSFKVRSIIQAFSYIISGKLYHFKLLRNEITWPSFLSNVVIDWHEYTCAHTRVTECDGSSFHILRSHEFAWGNFRCFNA